MLKKIVSLAVIGLLLNLLCNTSVAANSTLKEIEFAAKVKGAITKLGTGIDARIEVKLRDKTKLKGYISEAGDDSFVVVDDKNGTPTRVTYLQVKQVKGKNNLSGEKIALGVAIVAFLLLIAILQFNCNDNC